MKLHHLLAVSCTITSSALCASTKPSAVIQELAQPTVAVAASVDQRLSAFPSLIDIPKSAGLVLSIGDFRKSADGLMTHPAIMPLLAENGVAPAQVIAAIPDVTSATFAMTPDMEPLIESSNKMTYASYAELITQAWASASTEGDLIQSMGKKIAEQMMSGAVLGIPSMYMSVSFEKDSKYAAELDEMLKTTLNQLMTTATPEDIERIGLSSEEIPGGFIASVKVDFLLDMAAQSSMGGAASLNEGMAKALESMRGKKIFIAYSREGDRLRIALADDASKVQFPKSAAESVAASSQLDFSNEEITKNPVMLATLHVSDALNDSTLKTITQLPLGLAGIFTELGKKNEANKAVYDKGSTALELFSSLYMSYAKLFYASEMDCVIWADGNLNIEFVTNMASPSTTGKLVGMSRVDEPSTMMYLEMGGDCSCDINVTFDALLDSSVNLTEAVAMTLNNEMRSEILLPLQLGKAFIPDVKQLAANLGMAISGLDAPAGILIDNKGETINFLGGEAAKMPIPRAAIFSGVSDRAKVAKGWADALNTAKTFMSKIGQDAAMVDLISTTQSEKDGVALHVPAMPIFPEGLLPHIAITDKFWMLGSNVDYSVELQKGFAASAGTPFSGSVFAYNFAPSAELAMKMIDPKVSGDQDNNQMAIDYMNTLVEHFSGIYGVTTTENDKQVTRIRLQAK